MAPDQALSFLEVFSGRSPKYKGWFGEPASVKVHHLDFCRGLHCETLARICAAMVGPQVGLPFFQWNGIGTTQRMISQIHVGTQHVQPGGHCQSAILGNVFRISLYPTINLPSDSLVLKRSPTRLLIDDYNII